MFHKLIQYILRWLSIAILAKYHPKIVAVTGSVGKTSAKDAIFSVLDFAFPGRVRANQKNLNTEIGVPVTIIGGVEAGRSLGLWFKNFALAFKLILFKDKNYPDTLILEMAADKPGDIEYLTEFVCPDVAVMTAIGEMPVHLEFFGERDKYINEKSNVLKNLKPGGTAILNYDDLSVRGLRNSVPTNRERIYYGFQNGAEIEITDFSYNIPSKAFEILDSGMEFTAEDKVSADSAFFKITGILGLPVLYASLAGIAVGRVFGITLADSAKALEKFKPTAHRLELKQGIKDSIILDDSYNSSPLAAGAALEVLGKFKKNRKIVVLGSMRELGINMEEAHRALGKRAAKIADVIFLVGDETVFAKEEALKSKKILDENLFWFESSADATKRVETILQPGDVVLIKGSRSVKMEAVVEEITEEITNAPYFAPPSSKTTEGHGKATQGE